MNQLIIAIIFSVLPVLELRGGLPLAIDYALKNGISVYPIFLLILALNIAIIFFIFFFLDFLHEKFMSIGLYRKAIEPYLEKVQKKADKLEERMPAYGYLALTAFVAIPLPGTGAWTGSLISWLLDLDRKKSIVAIAFGVTIAGIIIFLASLGFLNMIY